MHDPQEILRWRVTHEAVQRTLSLKTKTYDIEKNKIVVVILNTRYHAENCRPYFLLHASSTRWTCSDYWLFMFICGTTSLLLFAHGNLKNVIYFPLKSVCALMAEYWFCVSFSIKAASPKVCRLYVYSTNQFKRCGQTCLMLHFLHFRQLVAVAIGKVALITI